MQIHDTERELHRFQVRVGVAAAVVLTCFGMLLGRFIYLQVVQYDIYHAKAEDNRISI